MKTLELESLGLEELESNEVQQIEGGWFIPLLVGVVLAGVVTDWPGFKQGLMDGLAAN